jgi:hypothetical protein
MPPHIKRNAVVISIGVRVLMSCPPLSDADDVHLNGDKPLHAKVAHVAQRHRRASGLLGFHLVASFSHSTDSLA